jgi:hypothetical protein
LLRNEENAPAFSDGRQSERALMVQRGVCRLFAAHGFATVSEVTLASGRRADVVGLGARGEVWIVEIKTSVEDYRADRKWPDYLDFCDSFFFATHAQVPAAIFPEETGLIIADPYGGEILRACPHGPLAPARRKAMTLRVAQIAAQRLHVLTDPSFGGGVRS